MMYSAFIFNILLIIFNFYFYVNNGDILKNWFNSYENASFYTIT